MEYSFDVAQRIRTLRCRARRFRYVLSHSELRTRESLIDPILELIGWPVDDPDKVVVDYRVRGRLRADYALLGPGRVPICFVEAKALGAVDADGAEQVLRYASKRRVRCAVLTDGDRWTAFTWDGGGWRSRSAKLTRQDESEFINFILSLQRELAELRREVRPGRNHEREWSKPS